MNSSVGIEVWADVTLSFRTSQAEVARQQLVHWAVTSAFGRSSVVPPPPPLVLKAPETVLLAFIVRLQGPVPVQSPLQPAKLEPAAGLAVSATAVPSE